MTKSNFRKLVTTKGNNFNKAIPSVAVRTLLPIVKFLLRHRIPYKYFCELAKHVYVDVALSEFSMPGKKQTSSRIATITGLSRKEVSRLRGIAEAHELSINLHNHAGRVICGWRQDPDFLDADGKPRKLDFKSNKSGFSLLVKKYSGDMPVKAILDELLRAEAVEIRDNNVLLLK